MTVAAALWALIKIIPGAIDLFKSLLGLYVDSQCANMRSDLRDAIKKALATGDQREIEKAIGNPHAGEPSNLPGTTIVDHLPGVK
jgi:hypothetical protein